MSISSTLLCVRRMRTNCCRLSTAKLALCVTLQQLMEHTLSVYAGEGGRCSTGFNLEANRCVLQTQLSRNFSTWATTMASMLDMGIRCTLKPKLLYTRTPATVLRTCRTTPPTDELTSHNNSTTNLPHRNARAQHASRHVKMLGCGKFLSVGGDFVVQVVELLWARPLVVSV